MARSRLSLLRPELRVMILRRLRNAETEIEGIRSDLIRELLPRQATPLVSVVSEIDDLVDDLRALQEPKA